MTSHGIAYFRFDLECPIITQLWYHVQQGLARARVLHLDRWQTDLLPALSSIQNGDKSRGLRGGSEGAWSTCSAGGGSPRRFTLLRVHIFYLLVMTFLKHVFISKWKLKTRYGGFLIMFTVSGRVINELVELTCAINFSLLFRFEARAQKSKTAEAFMVGWREGKGGSERNT